MWRTKLGALVALSSWNGMLAQTMIGYTTGILTGALYQRFALVMGVFTFFMGLGSFLLERVPRPRATLLGLQFLIPILVYFSVQAESLPFLVVWLSLLGFLSGGEFPLLVKITSPQDLIQKNIRQLLSLDYMAMAFGYLIFGLWLLQHLGVEWTFFVIAIGHLILGLGLVKAPC